MMIVVVFAGGFNNNKDIIRSFAKDADALIAGHAIAEASRGAYEMPSLCP